MTVEAERRASALSEPVRLARAAVDRAEHHARLCTIDYVDAALEAGWTWPRIGAELSLSATGIRRYYTRNRRKTHGGDI